MAPSYVVTGAGRGVGRAIAARLSERGRVIALDRDAAALRWRGWAGATSNASAAVAPWRSGSVSSGTTGGNS
jgi:NAD(P)-dependent dehydrogenase (short-subunit alcohol dehydrogenase family)